MTGKSSPLVPLDAKKAAGASLRPLFGMDTEALSEAMAAAGEPAWRGRQIAEAIYRQCVADLDGVTTLPLALRARLAAEGWGVGRPHIAQVFKSVDGTERYLVECRSGGKTTETVETVWMPEGDGGEAGDGSGDQSQKLGAPGLDSETGETAKPIQLGAPGLDSETWETAKPIQLGAPGLDSETGETAKPIQLGAPGLDSETWETAKPIQLGAPGLDSETGETAKPIQLGAPGLDSETWETAKLNNPGAKLGAPSFPRPFTERVGNLDSQSATVRAFNSDHPEKTWDRATICISSQVGCAVNCQFCLTAKLGLQRNLTAGEIAGQVVAVLDRQSVEVGRDRVNLVFMGMGEPFLNYDNFMAAVRLLVNEVGLSPQRMTVSTSGIVPGIERFAQEPAAVRPKLAISLNAPNDQIRESIMPINRKWPIEAVMDAVRQVELRPRERITFEYVLLGGVTDRPEHASEVARLVRRTGLPAKVNLIAWNPGPGIAYTTPQPEAVERFRATLAAEGIPAYLRRPRGRDIYAACGQLKRTVEG